MLIGDSMSEEEIKNKIEQISASIGLDFDDNELSNNEKDALFTQKLFSGDKIEIYWKEN